MNKKFHNTDLSFLYSTFFILFQNANIIHYFINKEIFVFNIFFILFQNANIIHYFTNKEF
jgi:hypothetical protein